MSDLPSASTVVLTAFQGSAEGALQASGEVEEDIGAQTHLLKEDSRENDYSGEPGVSLAPDPDEDGRDSIDLQEARHFADQIDDKFLNRVKNQKREERRRKAKVTAAP